MVVRILLVIMMIVLGAGFIFFAANVLWLGTKEFFKIYGPKSKSLASVSPISATATAATSAASTTVASGSVPVVSSEEK